MIHVFDVFLAPFGAKIKMQSSDTLFLASPFMVFFYVSGTLKRCSMFPRFVKSQEHQRWLHIFKPTRAPWSPLRFKRCAVLAQVTSHKSHVKRWCVKRVLVLWVIQTLCQLWRNRGEPMPFLSENCVPPPKTKMTIQNHGF